MLPTSVSKVSGTQSYGSVNQFSRGLWTVRKVFRQVKVKLAKENKVKLCLYVLFFLFNILWLGSTLFSLLSNGEGEQYAPTPHGSFNSHRDKFQRHHNSHKNQHDHKGKNVWGTTPTTRQQGHVGKQNHKSGGLSPPSSSSFKLDSSKDAESEILVRENVISSSSGEQISLDAKKVYINTKTDADSDLVIRGGSIHFDSLEHRITTQSGATTGGSGGNQPFYPCTQSRRGTVIYISGQGAEPDHLTACLKSSTGKYQWTSLVGGTLADPSGQDTSVINGGDTSSLPIEGAGVGGAVRMFDVGGEYEINEGNAVSYAGGKCFHGVSLHTSAPLEFGKQDIVGNVGSTSHQGSRKKLTMIMLSSKKFMLLNVDSVGNTHLQLGRTIFSGSQESLGSVLNKAKITFTDQGKVDEIAMVLLSDQQEEGTDQEDTFIVVYTEYQSGGKLMAIAGKVLSDDVVAFGVPLELVHAGARYLSVTPIGNNRIAVVYTRMKHHKDAKKGGCLVILEHTPKFKHLDLATEKGTCQTEIGEFIDGIKLVWPTRTVNTAMTNEVKIAIAYRDLTSRNAKVQHIFINENSEDEQNRLGSERERERQAALNQNADSGGNESLGNSTSSAAMNQDTLKDKSKFYKYSVRTTAPLVVHGYSARLVDLKMEALSRSHVLVTYADVNGAALLVLDVAGSVPSVVVGPTLFSNHKPISLDVRVWDYQTAMVVYSISQPVKLSYVVKVEISLGGAGSLHLHQTSVLTQYVTHSQIAPVEKNVFLYSFLLGVQQQDQQESSVLKGGGGVVAGVFGHIIGVATSSAMPGSKVPVQLAGVSKHHQNLFPGQCYYAASSGELTLVPTSTPIGLSISSTDILLFAPGCRTPE